MERMDGGLPGDLATVREEPEPAALEGQLRTMSQQGRTMRRPEAVPVGRVVDVAHRDSPADVDERRGVPPRAQRIGERQRLVDRGDAVSGVVAVEMKVHAVD